jgi:predicted Rossmann fold nucleotide-binding protein DprA/Smf involved in DNA uptake
MSDTGKALKAIADSLKALSKEINSIATQVGKATKPRTKTTAKTKPVKKATKVPRKTTPKKPAPASEGNVSITDTIFDAIKNNDGGITNASIIEKTGFTQKQIANVVLKLKKQGKIKSIGRGIFAGA